jgi:hypothetical protein
MSKRFDLLKSSSRETRPDSGRCGWSSVEVASAAVLEPGDPLGRQLQVEIVEGGAGLDVGTFHPFVEGVNDDEIGLRVEHCFPGLGVVCAAAPISREGLAAHAQIGAVCLAGVQVVPPGHHRADPEFGLSGLLFPRVNPVRPLWRFLVGVGAAGVIDLVDVEPIEDGQVGRIEPLGDPPGVVSGIDGLAYRLPAGHGALLASRHAVHIAEHNHRFASGAEEAGVLSVGVDDVTQRVDHALLVDPWQDVMEEGDGRVEAGRRLAQYLAEVGVGAVLGREPVDGEAIQAGGAGLPDVTGNHAWVVGLVDAVAGQVAGRGAAGLPCVRVIPGEVIAQHHRRDLRMGGVLAAAGISAGRRLFCRRRFFYEGARWTWRARGLRRRRIGGCGSGGGARRGGVSRSCRWSGGWSMGGRWSERRRCGRCGSSGGGRRAGMRSRRCGCRSGWMGLTAQGQ